jgi:hypothetical protein
VPKYFTPSLLFRISVTVVVAALMIPALPDVDLWGHTMFGLDILKAGAIPVSDHYSFTSDLPWINHEWLSEVFMGGSYAAFGGAGLVGLRLVLVSLFLWIVWRRLRRDGVSVEAAWVVLIVVALLTYPRTPDVRPQLFSMVAFAALVSAICDHDARPRAAHLFWMPILMAVWANFHGGFIVGLLPLGLWGAACVIESRGSARTSFLAAGVVCAAVLATLITPYGLDLWRFLWRTVGLHRSDIVEWYAMPNAGYGVFGMWLVALGLAIAGIRYQPGPRRPHRVALVVILGLASFKVSRLDAFFVTATIMCFGPALATLWEKRTRKELTGRLAPRMAAAVLVLCTCSAGFTLVRAAPTSNGCVETPDWLPEQAAAGFVARNHLQGRMIVFYNWGEYALWNFSRQLRVSMDGRRETVYSDRHINGHLQLYSGTDAGLAYAAELNPDYVWLPRNSPAIDKLRGRGWFAIYRGDRSVILSRTPQASSPEAEAPNGRCFPRDYGKPSPLSSGLWKPE